MPCMNEEMSSTCPMRRSERQLSKERAFQILASANYAIVSTLGADGFPYGVPVNFALEGDKVYFHCAKEVGLKLANIRQHPQVCLTVVAGEKLLPEKFSTCYESVIAFGHACLEEEPEHGLRLLTAKYSPGMEAQAEAYIARAASKVSIVSIKLDHVTAKGRLE